MNALLVQFEQFANAYMSILYLIVLAITATVIVNTLIMSVFERTREIGILSAIGMKGSRIMAMFFAESSLLAVGGILMGLVLGGVLVFYATRYGFYVGNFGVTGMTFGERIYASLTLSDTITLTIITFIVTLAGGALPGAAGCTHGTRRGPARRAIREISGRPDDRPSERGEQNGSHKN